MIIDKQPLPGDDVEFEDAPPSYDALEGVPRAPPPEKAGPSNRNLPPIPPATAALPSPTSLVSTPSGKLGSKRSTAWFTFGPSARAAKEVRITLLGLIRDLVKQGDARGSLGVLESCADACQRYDLSLSSLLQEHSVEGHTPIYWAIINRPPGPPSSDDPDLVSALISHAAPLLDATIDELRLACLHTSDHGFFQRLRRSPAFSPLTGAEEIILGGSVPIDDVEVEDVKEDEGAFLTTIRIPMFQKRMRISGAVRIEFIAKGRLWELSFFVCKESDRRTGYKGFKAGSWVVKLVLLPHSPPTWIDSRLVIEDPRVRSRPPPARAGTSFRTPTSLFEAVMREDTPKMKPNIELRLHSHSQLTAPRSPSAPQERMIVVALEENAPANSLQFNGCPYLESDGSLVARLEARLAPPDTECVIC